MAAIARLRLIAAPEATRDASEGRRDASEGTRDAPPATHDGENAADARPFDGRARRSGIGRRDARTLPRYGREEELTKPSVALVDWTGEDEVTVKWDTALGRVAAPEPAEPEVVPEAPGFRGAGGRAGGIVLGAVLGVAASILLFAFTRPPAAPPAQAPAVTVAQVPAAVAPPVPLETRAPVATEPPLEVLPIGVNPPPSSAKHHVRTALNMDSTEKAHVILDGRPLGSTPLRVSVSPGAHTVVFVHPKLGRRTLTVQAQKDRVTFATVRYDAGETANPS